MDFIRRPKVILAAALILLTVFGLIYLPFTWTKSKREIAQLTLKIAWTAKAGIIQGPLEQLYRETNGSFSVAYIDIKECLNKIAGVNKDIGFLYIYTQKNGKLYYLAESDATGNADNFKTRQEFTGAGKAYYQPFKNGRDLITGPETNNNGTWISILLPFKNSKTGDTFAVLAINYPANTWNNFALARTTSAAIIIFVLFLLELAMYKVLTKSEDLLKAKEAAEVANVAKSQFLANMSHEIRTPLNAITGFLQLLQQTEVNDIQKEYVQEGISASKILLNLINDILDFSKIEANKLSLEKINFSIRTIVDDTVSTLTPKAHEKNLMVYSYINSNVPDEVLGDPERLRQILNNLLSNAVKFTSSGEISVRAEMVEEDNNIATVSFQVTDTGIGISRDAITNLFSPFTQADNSTTRKFGGTGLGLAISKELVEMMDGKIGAHSVPGKGSTFLFTARFKVVSRINKAMSSNYTRFKNIKVLVADDNTNSREITCSYLKAAGFEVLEADNGETAVAELLKSQDKQTDVVISNLQISKINDQKLAYSIREIPALLNTQLIQLTSISQKIDMSEEKDKAFNAYINKPVKRDELINCILKLTDMTNSIEPVVKEDTKELPGEVKMEKKPRILLAEDNAINRKVIISMFNSKGLTCDVAVDGSEAYNFCLDNDYDIIFMDCQMPVMDGYEATRKIREAENTKKHTRIIAMTAYAMEGDREECLKAGMDDYISKPINFELLFKKIEETTIKLNLVHNDSEALDNSLSSSLNNSLNSFISETGLSLKDAQDIYDEFFSSLTEMLNNIEKFIGNDDYENLAKAAHQLKGASGNLRINEIYNLALELEMSAKAKNRSGCDNKLLEIKNYYSGCNYELHN